MFETTMTNVIEAPSPYEVAPESLIDELSSLFTQKDRLEARISALLDRVKKTSAHERDGYPSVTALLKHRLLLHPGEALRFVARGNGLSHAPKVAASYSTGALSGAQVDILLEGRSMAPVGFEEEEERLIDMAQGMPVGELRKLVDYWLDRERPDDLADSRELTRELRSLTLRRDGDMMRLNGWVDIEAGERLRAALEPGPPAEEDSRSTPARRADVLLDIINGASQRPNLLVHVSLETLARASNGISETAHGTFLTADEIRRLACDANITRVVFGPASQPLDVGRTKRLVTPALRVAVCARDRGCVFPGCDRPSHWCDAHHLDFWVEGGETCIENLILLCRHHHVLVHEEGWRVEGTPGHLRFHRPDGTELGIARTRGSYREPRVFDPTERDRTLPHGGIRELVRLAPRLRGP
ncbi:MAG TPA: DUF222 domain-containing protein [Acidimicrobiia bacterium]